MQIKKLLEEQEKHFKRLLPRYVDIISCVGSEFPLCSKQAIWNWHKQSLKQFIDGLVEREQAKFRDERPVDCIDGVTPVETYGYEATYNQAKKETISRLKEVRKQLE